MSQIPVWYRSVQWSRPIAVRALRSARSLIPHKPGVYVFTKHNHPLLSPGHGILYVGVAETALAQRLPKYLGDPSKTMILGRTGNISSSLKHQGKVQLLLETMHGDISGQDTVWVRWFPYSKAALLEGALMDYLMPGFNVRPEKNGLGPNDPLP